MYNRYITKAVMHERYVIKTKIQSIGFFVWLLLSHELNMRNGIRIQYLVCLEYLCLDIIWVWRSFVM